jgi:GNAT superfamily N-acetyltransferase
MKIRRVKPEERLDTSFPLTAYAFAPSPISAEEVAKVIKLARYSSGFTVLVAEEDGRTLATAAAIPMRQNVRGSVYPMAGIAGVATHPLARRQGHIRTLLNELLGQMRDSGHVVSALYPFRSSFYQRFGYIGLTKPPTVTFAPADLRPLLRADLPGEIGWERIKDGYDAYRELTAHLLERRHGFAEFPDFRAERLRDTDERWLVTARRDGAVIGALTYRITDHDGDLLGDHMLTAGPIGRALLLQFFAHHTDQVARVSVTVDPDESPEQWCADLAFVSESRAAVASSLPPMARVLSVDALAGMAVGPGHVAVTVLDDPFIAGEYVFDGISGQLDVARPGAHITDARPAATLTAAGLSGIIYGVLDPSELVIRGLGTVPDDAANQLRTLFPRRHPYVMAEF